MSNTNGCCLPMPIARLETVLNSNGELVGIKNVSEYNDAPTQTIQMRQAQWYLYKNGVMVHAFGMGFLNAPLSIGGTRTEMTLAQKAQTVFDFLTQQGVSNDVYDRIEVAIEVVNANNYRSNLSNKILVPRPTNGCQDRFYHLNIDNQLFCWTDYNGTYYTPQ